MDLFESKKIDNILVSMNERNIHHSEIHSSNQPFSQLKTTQGGYDEDKLMISDNKFGTIIEESTMNENSESVNILKSKIAYDLIEGGLSPRSWDGVRVGN